MTTYHLLIISVLFLLTNLYPLPVTAQVAQTSDLFNTIAKNDSLLFIEGFNKCNIDKFEDLIAKDLEFYHDTGGLQNRKQFFAAFATNVCADKAEKPIRLLVPNTIEVFSLNKNGKLYGAIQRGQHKFYIRKADKKLYPTGTAKFTHIWILRDERWLLKRVLSFDHQGLE